MINPKELGDKYDNLCTKLDALTNALHEFPRTDQQHSPQMREWEPFIIVDGATLVAGVGTLGAAGGHVPAANGWEGYVDRVSVLVAGASGNASGGLFRGSQGTQNMIDVIPITIAVVISTVTYYGNAANYAAPAYFRDGASVQMTITGADTTAGTQAFFRVEGRRRQI